MYSILYLNLITNSKPIDGRPPLVTFLDSFSQPFEDGHKQTQRIPKTYEPLAFQIEP